MAGFADLFGGMFGGGGPAPTPGLLDAAGYMDPAQYDAARRSQGMMGLWAGLLQGGGPSLEPRNFGSALGAGLVGQQKFGSTFDEDQLHASQAAAQRATVQKNLADIDIKKKGYQLAQDWLNKGEAPPGAVPDVPNFGAGTGGGGGGWGPHAPVAIETLKAAGYSDAAIAGIMANGLGEGGFKTNWQKAGGGENSFGHWQFNERGELPGLREFAKSQGGDPTDTRIQALYVAKRAEEVSPGFSKLTDPKLATDIFATKFERYKGAAPGQRYGLLADATRYMAGTPVEERLPIPAGPGGYAGPVPGGAIPEFAGGRAGALGGPVPAAVAGGPAAPVPGPLAAPAPPQEVGGGLAYRPGGRNWTPPVPVRGNAGGGGPPMLPPDADYGGGGDAGEGGPTYGSGVLRGPVPAAAVAPAPPVPAPPPVAPAPSPAALAPAAAAVALPPPPAGAVPGAAPAPGAMTVTLPPPPALPTMPAIPQAQPLPAAPETPAIPPRPQIPGVAPGAAVSPAVAARARQAQGVVLGLSMMGVHVPSFLEKEAGIEIAGRTAAAEAEARQPIELQNKTFEASLTAAQKRWDALNDQQKETLAFQRGLTKDQMNEMYKNIHEQYKAVLDLTTAGPKAQAIAEGQLPSEMQKVFGKEWAQLLREWDMPQQIKRVGPDGVERTITTTPRQMAGGLAPQQALNSSAGSPGAGPAAAGPAPAPGVVTGLGPGQTAELTGQGEALAKRYKTIQDDAAQASNDLSTLKVMQTEGEGIAARGILAPYAQHANRLINAITGDRADTVRSFEVVVKNGEELVRKATRDSDSQPAAIQLAMTRNSLPSPETSPAGFQRVVGDMIAVKEYQLYKRVQAERWLADPANNNSMRGFENSLPASSYAFIVNRMPQDQKIELFNKLRSSDVGRKEAGVLADQIQALRGAGF